MARRGQSPHRDRLLASAGELFYRDGIPATGVDAVAAAAKCTKPTLYQHFGSKQGLVEQVLEQRLELRTQSVTELLAGIEAPLAALRALVRSQAAVTAMEGFRGCPLVNASIELPSSETTRAIALRYKHWMGGILAALAAGAGLQRPQALARSLLMLFDGANALAYLEGTDTAGEDLVEASETLLEAHGAKVRRSDFGAP